MDKEEEKSLRVWMHREDTEGAELKKQAITFLDDTENTYDNKEVTTVIGNDSKKIKVKDQNKTAIAKEDTFNGGTIQNVTSFDKGKTTKEDIRRLYGEGYTQEEIEEITGWSQSTISRWINNK